MATLSNVSRDHLEDFKLEHEFRKTLRFIKPLVAKINSPQHLGQYRIWLEKLSDPRVQGKAQRNLYLKELAKQIEKQVLEEPFTEMPPKENVLPPFEFKYHCGDVCNKQHFPPNLVYLPYNHCPLPFITTEHTLPDKGYFVNQAKRISQNINNNLFGFLEQTEKPAICHVKKEEKDKKVDLKETYVDESNAGSSWTDLSEAMTVKSESSLGAMKQVPQKQIEEVPESVRKKISSLKLKSLYENDKYPTKLSDVTKIHSSIEKLRKNLEETQNQNNEFKVIIANLQGKLNEDDWCREQVKDETVSKLNKLHEEEIKKLQIKNEEAKRRLEETFEIKLKEVQTSFEQRLDEIKRSYELSQHQIKLDHEEIIRSKDSEISRLNDIIQQQCSRLSSEVSNLKTFVMNSNSGKDKISILQQCILKMDKLFKKSENSYLKQIERLKHEMQFKEKSTQIQLKTQRAEIVTQTMMEKQVQFESVLNNLELRYVKMFDLHESQSRESIKEYERKLTEMKNLLKKHNISYESDQ